MDPLGEMDGRRAKTGGQENADEGRFLRENQDQRVLFSLSWLFTPLVEAHGRGLLSAPLVCQEQTTIACLGTALDPTLGVEALRTLNFCFCQAKGLNIANGFPTAAV